MSGSWSVFQDVLNGEYVYPIEIEWGFKTKEDALKYMKENNLDEECYFPFNCNE